MLSDQYILNLSHVIYLYGYNIATASPSMTVPLVPAMRAAPAPLVVGSFTASNCSGINFSGVGTNFFTWGTTVTALGAFLMQNTNTGAGFTLQARL